MMSRRLFVCVLVALGPMGVRSQELPLDVAEVNEGIQGGAPLSSAEMQRRFTLLIEAINSLHQRVEMPLSDGTQNLAFHRDSGTGRFSIWCVAPQAEAGVAPCTEQNPGFVVMPSVRHGGLVRLKVSSDAHFFIDAQGASSLLGNSFNTEPRRPFAEPRPYFIYAANRDDTDAGLRFGLSPNPVATRVPQYAIANAGTVGSRGEPATDNQAIDFVFLADGRAELIAQFVNDEERPVMRIGSIEMMKVVRGQVDDWQVMPPRRGVGLGRYPWNRDYTLPPGAALGSGEGSYFGAEQGAPDCRGNQFYSFRLSPDGLVRVAVRVGACRQGVVPPPRVALRLVAPYAGAAAIEVIDGTYQYLGSFYGRLADDEETIFTVRWTPIGGGFEFFRWPFGDQLADHVQDSSFLVGPQADRNAIYFETSYRAFLD